MKNYKITVLRLIYLFFATLMTIVASQAQEKVKIGLITTLSGPGGYLGQDIRDGFELAVEMNGGKLGQVPIELIVQDDSMKPVNAKLIADRLMNDEGVRYFTGFIFANIAGAAVPDMLDNDAIYVSSNTASSYFAGENCHQNYFVSSWQDDGQGESAGQLTQSLGFKKAFLVAPNYQAGKETMIAFKRYYKGEVVGEIYTGLEQTDFSAELARIRAANPDVVYEFEPGSLGIMFIRQYQQAGLLQKIPLVVHPASMDEVILESIGEAAEGIRVTSHWNRDFDNPTNHAFVKAWKEKYGDRPISYYAAQGYDTALLMGIGFADATKIDVNDFRAALLQHDIPSVRGKFQFGANQHPIQDWFGLIVTKDSEGKMVLSTETKVFTNHSDEYVNKCKIMK